MSTLTVLLHFPLEVEQNIIDQLSEDVNSLRSCALTCRGWNCRARSHLMSSIRIRSREDLYSIIDYIASNPDKARVVQSLSMSPDDTEVKPRCLLEVLPVYLLTQLKHLQRYSIVGTYWNPAGRVSVSAVTLRQIRTYLYVEELRLASLEFRTSGDLARFLVALPCLRCLTCAHVGISRMDTSTDAVRFRDKCHRLSEVTIWSPTDVATVGLIVNMSLSTLNVLRYCWDRSEDIAGRLDLSELKRLRDLHLMHNCHPSIDIDAMFNNMVPLLRTLSVDTLRSLTITVMSVVSPSSHSALDTSSDRTHPLDDVILSLGNLRVVVSIPKAKRDKLAPWSKLIRRRFPRLHSSKLLQVQCASGDPEPEVALGHDAYVTAIAASPASGYVATGANDGTVIIWNGNTSQRRGFLEVPCLAQRGHVRSLHFSDNGEFLTGMCRTDVIIWRVVDGGEIAALRVGPMEVYCCAWQRDTPDQLTLSIMESLVPELAPRSAYHLSVTKMHVARLGTEVTSESTSSSPDCHPAVYDSRFKYNFIAQSSSGLVIATCNPVASACYIWRMVALTSTYQTHLLDLGLPHSYPSCASFVGDTQLVVGFDDGTIRWWDICSSTVELRGVLSLSSVCSQVASLSMSPRHSFLIALCSDEPTALVLRRTSLNHHPAPGRLGDDFALHVVLQQHTGTVRDACFSPCDQFIATASDDRTVRLWSTRDGELLWIFRDHQEAVTHVVFSSDGRILASADRNGRVCMHVLPSFLRNAPVSSVGDT